MKRLPLVGGLPYPFHANLDPPRSHLSASAFRTIFAIATQRCTICGHPLDTEPRKWGWVTIEGLPRSIRDTLRRTAAPADISVRMAAAIEEGAAHRICMIYSFVACPFLQSDSWRYRRDADLTRLKRSEGAASGGKVLVSAVQGRREIIDPAAGPSRVVLYGDTQIHLLRPAEVYGELAAAAQLPEPADDPVVAAARGSEDNIIAMALVVVLRGVAVPEPEDPCPCRSGTAWKHCHASMAGNLDLLIRELAAALDGAQRTTVEQVTTPGGPGSFPAIAMAVERTRRARRGTG